MEFIVILLGAEGGLFGLKLNAAHGMAFLRYLELVFMRQ